MSCQIYVCVMAMSLLSHGRKLFYEASFSFMRKVTLEEKVSFELHLLELDYPCHLGPGFMKSLRRSPRQERSATLHRRLQTGSGVPGATLSAGVCE